MTDSLTDAFVLTIIAFLVGSFILHIHILFKLHSLIRMTLDSRSDGIWNTVDAYYGPPVKCVNCGEEVNTATTDIYNPNYKCPACGTVS